MPMVEVGDTGSAHRIVRGEPLITAVEGEFKNRVEKSATIVWEKWQDVTAPDDITALPKQDA